MHAGGEFVSMTEYIHRTNLAKENLLRDMRKAGLAFAAVLLAGAFARAGQPIDINSMPAGTRFCPAPGADNSEFMSSYFSIDARTGRMTRHDPNSGPVGMTPEPAAKEEVLFVSPPISVENVYVPPPGGPRVPPQTRATGVILQPPAQRPQAYHPQPQQQAARPQAYPQPPQRPVYAQPRPAYPQPYPSHASAQPQFQPQHLQPYPQQSYLR